jgi:hypothetical protein
VPSGQSRENGGCDGIQGGRHSPQRPNEDGDRGQGCKHRVHPAPDDEQFARAGQRIGSLHEHRRHPADGEAGDGRSDDSIEWPIRDRRLGEPDCHEGGREGSEGRPEKGEFHLPVQKLIDLKSEGLLVDRTIVDLDQFAASREKIGAGHTDAPVLGDRHSIVIEVVNEREVELVEEKTCSALAVVVVDPDECDFVAELGVGLSKKGGLGPAGEAPGRPDIHDRRSIEVGQHLLKFG